MLVNLDKYVYSSDMMGDYKVYKMGETESTEIDAINEGSEENEIDFDALEAKGEIMHLPIDTTDDFADVFSMKDKFESWQDFIELFEEFQRRSQTGA